MIMRNRDTITFAEKLVYHPDGRAMLEPVEVARLDRALAADAPWHSAPSWLNQMRRGDFHTDYQEAE